MGWLDRRDQRVWDRFVRAGGPSRADRLTLTQPWLVWAGLTAFMTLLYIVLGRLLFAGQGGVDLVTALLYGAMFSGVWVVLSRRTLRDAIQRWDEQGGAQAPGSGGGPDKGA